MAGLQPCQVWVPAALDKLHSRNYLCSRNSSVVLEQALAEDGTEARVVARCATEVLDAQRDLCAGIENRKRLRPQEVQRLRRPSGPALGTNERREEQAERHFLGSGHAQGRRRSHGGLPLLEQRMEVGDDERGLRRVTVWEKAGLGAAVLLADEPDAVDERRRDLVMVRENRPEILP